MIMAYAMHVRIAMHATSVDMLTIVQLVIERGQEPWMTSVGDFVPYQW